MTIPEIEKLLLDVRSEMKAIGEVLNSLTQNVSQLRDQIGIPRPEERSKGEPR